MFSRAAAGHPDSIAESEDVSLSNNKLADDRHDESPNRGIQMLRGQRSGEHHVKPEAFSARMDVHVDFEADADTLFVFFGGIAGGMGMPPFEFMRIMESIRAKKLFLRDLAQAWYQSGLPSIGPRLVDVTGYLRQTIESADCRNVVFMGNSMGGFAAILFGASLKVTAVHAFSPQTSITRRYRLQQWDRRWRSQIHRAYSCAPKAELCLDVSPIVEHAKGRTPIHIYFGETNRLDRAHATRMAKLPGVRLHAYAEGGHQLVRHLRDSGELASILHHAL